MKKSIKKTIKITLLLMIISIMGIIIYSLYNKVILKDIQVNKKIEKLEKDTQNKINSEFKKLCQKLGEYKNNKCYIYNIYTQGYTSLSPIFENVKRLKELKFIKNNNYKYEQNIAGGVFLSQHGDYFGGAYILTILNSFTLFIFKLILIVFLIISMILGLISILYFIDESIIDDNDGCSSFYPILFVIFAVLSLGVISLTSNIINNKYNKYVSYHNSLIQPITDKQEQEMEKICKDLSGKYNDNYCYFNNNNNISKYTYDELKEIQFINKLKNK